MKDRLGALIPVFILLFIGFVFINKSTQPSITLPIVQVSPSPEPVQQDIEISTPMPTSDRQQVLNPATATAIAPFSPTQTPIPTPTLIPDSFAPGGENDAILSLWFTRTVGFVFLCGLFWVAYLIYQIKIYEIEIKARIEAMQIQSLTKLKVNPRPILSTNIIKSDDGDKIKLSTGYVIDKKRVIEFLNATFDDSDERGLAVSRWKGQPDWQQADIENILDHLSEASMVSKRQTGKACEWLVAPEKNLLCRQVFRLSPYELEEY